MVAKIMAVVVAVLLLGGAAQATSYEPDSVAQLIDDDPIALAKRVELVVAVPTQVVSIEMPHLTALSCSGFSSRTFRPPRP